MSNFLTDETEKYKRVIYIAECLLKYLQIPSDIFEKYKKVKECLCDNATKPYELNLNLQTDFQLKNYIKKLDTSFKINSFFINSEKKDKINNKNIVEQFYDINKIQFDILNNHINKTINYLNEDVFYSSNTEDLISNYEKLNQSTLGEYKNLIENHLKTKEFMLISEGFIKGMLENFKELENQIIIFKNQKKEEGNFFKSEIKNLWKSVEKENFKDNIMLDISNNSSSFLSDENKINNYKQSHEIKTNIRKVRDENNVSLKKIELNYLKIINYLKKKLEHVESNYVVALENLSGELEKANKENEGLINLIEKMHRFGATTKETCDENYSKENYSKDNFSKEIYYENENAAIKMIINTSSSSRKNNFANKIFQNV